MATETEEFVMGCALVCGGLVITIGSLLSGARWWFVLPVFAVAAVVKGYGWSVSVDEAKLDAAPETSEHPRMRRSGVLLRMLPALAVWFGLDVALLLDNPDVAGGAGGGVSLGIGSANLLTALALARYGRRHSVVIASDAPRLYLLWRRPDWVVRAPRS